MNRMMMIRTMASGSMGRGDVVGVSREFVTAYPLAIYFITYAVAFAGSHRRPSMYASGRQLRPPWSSSLIQGLSSYLALEKIQGASNYENFKGFKRTLY